MNEGGQLGRTVLDADVGQGQGGTEPLPDQRCHPYRQDGIAAEAEEAGVGRY